MNLFEHLYYLGYSAKKAYTLNNQKHLPCRVISIGNITVGGTGKTPATIALAEESKRRGFHPVILTRGYKGTAKGPCFVTTGEKTLLSFDEAGDEPVLMAEKLRGIPIVKGSDRYESGIFALKQLETRKPKSETRLIFILDDGFQHWRLFRDRDILLIDAENPFGNRKLLPSGILREPLEEIKRADIIVITKAGSQGQETANEIIKELKQYNSGAQIFLGFHKAVHLMDVPGTIIPLEQARGKNIFAFCGLGNPDSFRKTILSFGGILKGFRKFRDHYVYNQDDINRISREAHGINAEWIVTTKKDIIKMQHLDLPENILIIEVEFSINDDFYNTVLNFHH